MENKPNYTSLVIIVSVVCLVSATGGYFFAGTQTQDRINEAVTEYRADLESLQSKIDEEFPESRAEYQINGYIKEIHDNKIIFEFSGFFEQRYPWEESKEIGTKQRTIIVSDSTILTDQTVENENFFEEREIQKIPLAFDEIKEGNKLQVRSDVDIKTNEEFTATEIYLLER